MSVQLHINGYFDITFFNIYTGEEIIEDDIKQGILDNLQQGEYVIGFDSGKVFDINDFSNPVYTFKLNVTDSVEYEFEDDELV